MVSGLITSWQNMMGKQWKQCQTFFWGGASKITADGDWSSDVCSSDLALFAVMLPKAHLTLHSKCLALGELSHHRGYLGHEDLFCIAFLCILATSS